jgi:hypothetical protein
MNGQAARDRDPPVRPSRLHQMQRVMSNEHSGGARPPSRTPPELETLPLSGALILGQCTYSKVQYSSADLAEGHHRSSLSVVDGWVRRRRSGSPQP